MSHPWKAQPYYMLQQPRTSAPVPAPLGGYGVRVALAGYTRGSFTPKSPWNVPKYIVDEPTGVSGFRGFGATAGACVPAAQLAAEMMKTVDTVLSSVLLPSWAASKLNAPSAATLWSRIPAENRLALLTRAVNTIAGLASTGQERVKAFFAELFKQIASFMKLDVAVEAAWPVVRLGVPAPAESTPWREMAKQAQAGLWGDMLQTSVCLGETVSNPYDRYGPSMCPTLCTAAAAAGLSETQKRQLDEWCAGPTCQQTAAPIYSITGTAILPKQIVATGIKLAAKPTPVVPTAAAPKAGVSPLLIIGAAGLAAMLLLK